EFLRRDHPGLSSVPRGSIAAASVVLGITTKTCLTQRLRCHQPPRDKTLSSDPYRSTARGGRFARDWLWSLLLDLCITDDQVRARAHTPLGVVDGCLANKTIHS